MFRLIKFFLAAIVICLGLGIGLIALAQETAETGGSENEIIEDVGLDEEVSAEELEVEEPKILPDSPVYFLKNWGRGIRLFFTFDKVKKLELENKFANERLVELKKLSEEKKDPELLKRAAEKYKETAERIESQAEKIKEKAGQNPEVEKFLEKYTRQQILHQKILEKLEEKAPAEVFEKIEEAREKHLEKFKDVMLRLEEKEKIGKRLENALKEQKGSDFQQFKQIELLERIKEKMPEEAKEEIIEVKERTLEKLKNKLEGLPVERQKKFQEYINTISGDKEKQAEILENLRTELKEKPELIERLIPEKNKPEIESK